MQLLDLVNTDEFSRFANDEPPQHPDFVMQSADNTRKMAQILANGEHDIAIIHSTLITLDMYLRVKRPATGVA